MANRAPGVYRNEVSPKTSINSRVDNVVAVVGTAKTGPTEPTLIYSAPHRAKVFGPIMDNDFGLFAVDEIVKNTNQVLFCRVVNKGKKAIFKDTETPIFEAKEGGTHLNEAEVEVKVEDDTITVILTKSEVVLEKINVSKSTSSVDYVLTAFNNYSQYLNVVAGAEYSFAAKKLTIEAGTEGAKPSTGTSSDVTVETKYFDSYYGGATFNVSVDTQGRISASLTKDGVVVEAIPSLTKSEKAPEFIKRFNESSELLRIKTYPAVKSCSVKLVAGNDGSAGITADDFIGNSVEGIRCLEDPDVVEVDTLIVPGKFDPKIVSAGQKVMNIRQDCEYIPDPPLGLRAYAMRDWVEATGSFTSGSRVDSDYAAVYSPWVKYPDATGNIIFVPPSIVIACLLVTNDATKNVWDAPAGARNGILQGVVGLEYNPTRADREILYTNSIVNPIVFIKDKGYVVWGNKTARRAKYPNNPEPATSLNVRRLVNHIKKKVSGIALELVFANNDSFTWDEFKLNVDPFLRAIKDNRGLYDFDIIMDERTVTPEMIDALRMPGKIILKPTRAAEVIELGFELSPSGVAFNHEEYK